MAFIVKKGIFITTTNRRHSKFVDVKHGQPFFNDVARVGTKGWQKAGSGGAKSRGFKGGNGGRERQARINELNSQDQIT